MELFSWSLDRVTFWLWIALGVLAVSLLIAAIRAPLLVKLGLRNIGRRLTRAVLIICGLMLSSLVIGSALGTGDSISHTLRTVVTGSLGTIDEVVVRSPPRNRLRQRLRALTEPGFGGLAAAGLDFFPETEIERIADVVEGNIVAGVAPAIVDSVTIVASGSQQLQSSVPLVAVAPLDAQDGQQPFGTLLTTNGQPINLEQLPTDHVVLNVAAAESLRATVGQQINVLRREITWNAQVYAISANGGIGGNQPLVLVPLTQYQQMLGIQGQVNLLLVANRGGVEGISRSSEAAQELRARLVDRAVAQELKTVLARPEVQRGMPEVEGLVSEGERIKLAALRAAALEPVLTDQFVSLISDPTIRARLFSVAWRLPRGSDGQNPYQLLQNVADLSVLEIKQETLNQAREYGGVITTVFLVLGIFSLAATVVLIILVFALLAADRSTELATLRAIGMRRRQIMALFLWEGLAYNVLGALLGTLLSLLTGFAIVAALGQSLSAFGLELRPYVEPRSVLTAFAVGVLLTFAVMLIAAWRVSRLQIVAGARGEIVDETRWRQSVMGVTLIVGAAVVWWQWHVPVSAVGKQHPLVMPVTLSLIVLGCTSFLLSLRYMRSFISGATTRMWLSTIAGTLVSLIWLRLLMQSTQLAGSMRETGLVIAAAGIALICAVVWTAAHAVGPLLTLLDWLLTPWGRLRAVVRPAAGYLTQQRGRATVTMALFGMVIFIMVAALTLIDVLINAYGNTEPPVAGFDLRVDVGDTSAIGDFGTALSTAPAVSRATFGAVGGLAGMETIAIQLDAPRARWQTMPLAIVDDAFLNAVRVQTQSRSSSFADDQAVWTALQEQPGTAVITGQLPDGFVLSQPPTAVFEPFTVWLRPEANGSPAKVRVLGVIDPNSDLEPGIYTSRTTAAKMGVALPAPRSYFLSLAQGIQPRDAAQGLQISFGSQGVRVITLGEAALLIQTIRLLLVQIVQGFLGLGLLAGIVAVGLLGVQAVLERRQQLGTLRSLGFTSWQLCATIVVESGMVAVVGIATGVAAGLVLARSLIAVFALSYPELIYSIPWQQIMFTVGLAWLGSTVIILVAAWQASRVAPAEALRVT